MVAKRTLAGQRFGRWPVQNDCTIGKNQERRWLCRCDCGNEVEYSQNVLVHTNLQSCGCQRKENDAQLHEKLTFVDGTNVDRIKSDKLSANNTTGYRGVYLVNGKYQAKIVFQKKPYYLGQYSNVEDAAEARKEAEEVLFKGTAEYYERWKARADGDPQWAAENPVEIRVFRSNGKLCVEYSPDI